MKQQANEDNGMNVKRYVAEDMRQALKQIRDELGPDAVILSNRRVNGGVEIFASVDGGELPAPQAATFEDKLADDKVELSSLYDVAGRFQQPEAAATAEAAPEPAQKVDESPLGQRRTAVRQRRLIEEQFGAGQSASGQAQIDDTFAHMMTQSRQPLAAGQGNNELLDAMRSEIDSLRLLLKDQMEHNSDERWAMKNPLEAAVVQRLVGQGISSTLARKLAHQQDPDSTIEEAWDGSLYDLAKSIPVLDKSPVSQRGVIAFLGASGAGKTTTIAKLAVRYALKFGPDQLALVTTDSYRLGAYEELRTLGRIIDVPIRQVDEHNSLEDVLASLKHKSMILIDTAGFHSGDKERMQQLNMLKNSSVPIKKLLVLPSTSQGKVLKSMYELMASVNLDGCVVTKVDETNSLGEVLSLVVENKLSVAYITNGQKIPDDIGKARPEKLVQGLNARQPKTQNPGSAPFNTIRTPAPVVARQYVQTGIV